MQVQEIAESIYGSLFPQKKSQNCERDVELIIHNCEEKKGELYGGTKKSQLPIFIFHSVAEKSEMKT